MAYDHMGNRIESEALKRSRTRVAAVDPSAGPVIANPTTNIGAIGDSASILGQGKTDDGAWDAMFKPRAQQPTGVPVGSPWSGVSPASAHNDMNAGTASLAVASPQSDGHAAAWTGGAGGWQSPVPGGTQANLLSKYITPGTVPNVTFTPGQNDPANLAKRQFNPVNPWA